MKWKILLLLIVASAICAVRSEPSRRRSPATGGSSGNPLGIIKAELVEEDASALGAGPLDPMEASEDQAEAASSQRIIIKPIKRRRGKRIHIRLVNAKKPKNFVRLKVAGTKNVEQKYPGDNDEDNEHHGDYEAGTQDEEGYESSHNSYTEDGGEDDDSNLTSATEEQQTGEDAMKVKHHHHHHHHNHIKTVVKKVPEPYEVEKIVHVPVEKIVHVPKPYPVEKIIEKIVHVPKPYPVEKIVHVPKIVEKIVYSPLFGSGSSASSSSKDSKFGSATSGSSNTKSFADLTTDPKLKFGASGSSLDIIYPNGHSSMFPSHNNANSNGLFNSYGQPLGKHPKFPEFEDINKPSHKFHSILDNDAFDFGGLPSKPKDHNHHHHSNNNSNGKKKNKNSNKNRNSNNNNNKNKNNQNKNKGLFSFSSSSNKPKNHHQHHDDDYFSSSSSHSHSTGIQLPSYTHEYTLSSNSDQKEVFYNPAHESNAAGPNHHHSHHHHQVHYESLPFKYPPAAVTDTDSDYVGHASTQSADYSQFNWTPSVGDFGSTSSAFTPSHHFGHSSSVLAGAESAQSPIGPVFRPPPPARKSPASPFGKAKRGSLGAPRAGPRRPRNNSGESTALKMAGHHHHRTEGGMRAAASELQPVVQPLRLRPVKPVAEKQHLTETVMMAPETAEE